MHESSPGTPLRYGYVSNGFRDHTIDQMTQVLRRFGYDGVGLTIDPVHIDPFEVRPARLDHIRRLLESRRLAVVVETGARYVLDAFRKHRPSLVSVDAEGRRARIEYYRRAIDIAARLGATCVSLWSGTPQRGVPHDRCWSRLVDGLRTVCDHAHERSIAVAFEPEPGMFIETLAQFRELNERLEHPALKLTLDLGHVAITEKPPF
ncbi:MAG: sugar phosphate isomerase/epimerase, partial [Planctomycetes bacterium]|nr:sugar phosphate isomerase/epimerase [Planctomycetota bacterium]